jgi:hypothetical protein
MSPLMLRRVICTHVSKESATSNFSLQDGDEHSISLSEAVVALRHNTQRNIPEEIHFVYYLVQVFKMQNW